jgi:hypothetical protein
VISQRVRRPNEPQAARELFAPDKPYVAGLTSDQIEQMPERELVDAIRASHLPLGPEVSRGLQYYGRDALMRLLFLARKTCRHQGY